MSISNKNLNYSILLEPRRKPLNLAIKQWGYSFLRMSYTSFIRNLSGMMKRVTGPFLYLPSTQRVRISVSQPLTLSSELSKPKMNEKSKSKEQMIMRMLKRTAIQNSVKQVTSRTTINVQIRSRAVLRTSLSLVQWRRMLRSAEFTTIQPMS
jgi:hypothetical protein